MSKFIRVTVLNGKDPDAPAVPAIVNAYKVELVHQVPGSYTVLEFQRIGSRAHAVRITEPLEYIQAQLCDLAPLESMLDHAAHDLNDVLNRLEDID